MHNHSIQMVGWVLNSLFVSMSLTQWTLKTALLVGTATSYTVCTMCHFWRTESGFSEPSWSRSAVIPQYTEAQREEESTLNWNRRFEEDSMLSRVLILSLVLNHSFPFAALSKKNNTCYCTRSIAFLLVLSTSHTDYRGKISPNSQKTVQLHPEPGAGRKHILVTPWKMQLPLSSFTVNMSDIPQA